MPGMLHGTVHGGLGRRSRGQVVSSGVIVAGGEDVLWRRDGR